MCVTETFVLVPRGWSCWNLHGQRPRMPLHTLQRTGKSFTVKSNSAQDVRSAEAEKSWYKPNRNENQCTKMFVTVLFKIANNWTQPECCWWPRCDNTWIRQINYETVIPTEYPTTWMLVTNYADWEKPDTLLHNSNYTKLKKGKKGKINGVVTGIKKYK